MGIQCFTNCDEHINQFILDWVGDIIIPLSVDADDTLWLYRGRANRSPALGIVSIALFLTFWLASFCFMLCLVVNLLRLVFFGTPIHLTVIIFGIVDICMRLLNRYHKFGKPISNMKLLVFFFALDYFPNSTIRVNNASQNPYFKAITHFLKAKKSHGEGPIEFKLRDLAQLIETIKKSDDNKLAFLTHSHGIYSICNSVLSTCPFIPRFHCVIAKQLFYLGHLMLFYISTATIPTSDRKENLERIMRGQMPFCLLPGGFEEATVSSQTVERYYLQKRWGIFKLAKKYNYDLVPVLAVGENMLLNNLQTGIRTRLWINKFKIPTVLAYGMYFSYLPYRIPVHIVVCDIIKADAATDATDLKNCYIGALRKQFLRFNHLYQDSFAALNISKSCGRSQESISNDDSTCHSFEDSGDSASNYHLEIW